MFQRNPAYLALPGVWRVSQRRTFFETLGSLWKHNLKKFSAGSGIAWLQVL